MKENGHHPETCNVCGGFTPNSKPSWEEGFDFILKARKKAMERYDKKLIDTLNKEQEWHQKNARKSQCTKDF